MEAEVLQYETIQSVQELQLSYHCEENPIWLTKHIYTSILVESQRNRILVYISKALERLDQGLFCMRGNASSLTEIKVEVQYYTNPLNTPLPTFHEAEVLAATCFLKHLGSWGYTKVKRGGELLFRV